MRGKAVSPDHAGGKVRTSLGIYSPSSAREPHSLRSKERCQPKGGKSQDRLTHTTDKLGQPRTRLAKAKLDAVGPGPRDPDEEGGCSRVQRQL